MIKEGGNTECKTSARAVNDEGLMTVIKLINTYECHVPREQRHYMSLKSKTQEGKPIPR